MLTPAEAIDVTRELLAVRAAERPRLDLIRAYWRGTQALPVVPSAVPIEVRRMAEMSRINVCALAVNVPAQAIGGVVGLRDENAADNDPLWGVWQANKMDAHQAPIHRACFGYGVAYAKLLPGDPAPVSVGRTPRQLTTLYGADPDWPVYALDSAGNGRWLLYDATHVHELSETNTGDGDDVRLDLVSQMEHGAGVCPVVRFRNLDDLEDELWSEVEAVMSLQDQLDFTTFDMLVAQHYGAFRQRYVLGWTSDDETAKARAAASRLWTFDDEDVKVGEFNQTDMSGYLKSRRATLEHFGVVSQVPPHNLIGPVVNLSAEALVAAEVGATRKNTDRETSLGESWEQWFWLAGRYTGSALSDGAQVRWRDTEARSLAQTVDALGKMAQMLSVPVEMLWEKIPGFTQQDVERAKSLVQNGEFEQLIANLNQQATQPAA